MPERGALLAIDYGTRKAGLAIGHHLTGSAQPLEPIRYRQAEALLAALQQVVQRWRPGRIIIGLPLAADGAETDMSRSVRAFADQLSVLAPDCPISLHDERMSSQEAARGFAQRREQGRARRRDAARLDSMAAALILESWISEHRHG
jgi:putative Holliday junction resolvase